MKHEEVVGVRMPRKLRKELEQERRRMSKAAGAEVKMSSAIRALLERALSKAKDTRAATA